MRSSLVLAPADTGLDQEMKPRSRLAIDPHNLKIRGGENELLDRKEQVPPGIYLKLPLFLSRSIFSRLLPLSLSPFCTVFPRVFCLSVILSLFPFVHFLSFLQVPLPCQGAGDSLAGGTLECVCLSLSAVLCRNGEGQQTGAVALSQS